MATDFFAEAVVEAFDRAAIEIANYFPFLSKLSRLSKVLHCGFLCPPRIRVPSIEIPSYCISLVSFMTSFSSDI